MNESIVKYVSVALAWSAYFALHSMMISITVTEYLKRELQDRFRFYRLFFNVVALVALVPLLVYSGRVVEAPFFAWDGYFAVAKWSLFAGGILLFAAGSRHYSFSRFIGVRQLREGARHGLMNGTGKLDSGGILGFIRHPYYSGVILLFWSGDLDATRLVINSVVTVYIVIGTRLEERKLILEFGEHYWEYQARVSMFVPWKRIKSLLGLWWSGALKPYRRRGIQ